MKIPLFKIYSDEKDIAAVNKVIRRGTFWAIGPEIEEFESKVKKYVKVKYALAFNSGTSALHTLLVAHNIKGGEVIVPSFTFISTVNSIVLAGGKPIFAETEEDTCGLDIKDVEKKITKKTKAILALHYGGFISRDIIKLKSLAKKHNILLIEDAAESFGSKIKDKMTGSFGDSAIFSMCQNKIFSTGEGGLLVTNSRDIYEKAKLIRSHGRVDDKTNFFEATRDPPYIQIGYNMRFPTILAALAISQLNKVDMLIKKRRALAKYFTKELSKIKEISFLKEIKNHYQVYQMYTIKLPTEQRRNSLKEYLIEKGIMCKVYFEPVHLKEVYKKNKCKLPNTEQLSKVILNLPIYVSMNTKEKEYLVNTIKRFFK